MELVELLNRLNESISSFILDSIPSVVGFDYREQWQVIWLLALLSVTTGAVLILFLIRRWKSKGFLPEVKKLVGVGQQAKPRFRKRDKVLFYGRKMLRKMKVISGQVKQGKKRKLMIKLAHRLLRLKKDESGQELTVLEPPAEYLQEDTKADQRVPLDAFYMLQSIRVFGDFEKPVFLKLCKFTEIMNLSAGAYLFKVGDPDENVFVLQSGKVNVFINSSDGSSISLKQVKAGESITSLLSFTDVLTGHPNPYKTVSARVVEDATVVKLPMAAFQEVFKEFPDTFIRVMQVIMVRLQRVTFTALHQYLGLSAELVNPGRKRQGGQSMGGGSSGGGLLISNSGSPIKGKTDPFPPSSSVPSENTQDDSWPEEGVRTARKSVSSTELKFHHSYSVCEANDPALHEAKEFLPVRRKTLPCQETQDNETLVKMAKEAIVAELGLTDASLLDPLEIKHVSAGTYLMKENEKDMMLIYLLSGLLSVSQKVSDGRPPSEPSDDTALSGRTPEQVVHMFTAHPGEIVGGLAVLTGEPSFFTIKAKHPSTIAIIAKNTVYNILREKPEVALHISHTVVRRLSPFVRQVDFALDWVFLESGRAVYRQGDDSDSTFIVLSGRLRSVITHSNGKKELVSEYGKGDLVGIVEMVTGTKRSTTVIAVRDSELARLPEGLFNAIKLRFPIVVTRLINLLGHRIIGSWQTPSIGRMESRANQNNFSTVAIVPVSDDVPLTAFTFELYHSLNYIGPTLKLTSESVRKALGMSVLETSQEYRLTSWLAQQEDQHRICLYQCDSAFTTWTQRCIRQADCVLIVGLAFKEPTIGKIEQEIERLAIRTHKELVLLHKEGGERPKNTVQWLNIRNWVSSHHHIQCNKRIFSRRSHYRLNELYSKVLMSEPSVHSDFSRLARWLTGMSVGLVLGGGGAKGASHVGLIKAIEEAGVPIDMVGGVSIGAFIGALYCMHRDITTVTQKAREWSNKMNKWWSLAFDLTYPVTSMFTGRAFNRTLVSAFSETTIEDLWLPYFTVSTDISASAMRIHRHGVVWRYVRASMSLSGYMPPLCDPMDGHLLLDGGYVNNLPADVMKNFGARHVLAIDVGSQDDTDLTNYGDSLSGWWLLWKRLPFTSPVKVPNLPDIQSRLAYVSCVRQLEEVKNSDYCQYIRPPIDKYKTLQFGSFDEIREVGYNHGKACLGDVVDSGLPVFLKTPAQVKAQQVRTGAEPSMAYRFTDLAQMVCKVSKDKYQNDDDTSSEDYEADEEDAQEIGYASEPSAHILAGKSSLLRRRTFGSLSLSEAELETESEIEFEQPTLTKRT